MRSFSSSRWFKRAASRQFFHQRNPPLLLWNDLIWGVSEPACRLLSCLDPSESAGIHQRKWTGSLVTAMSRHILNGRYDMGAWQATRYFSSFRSLVVYWPRRVTLLRERCGKRARSPARVAYHDFFFHVPLDSVRRFRLNSASDKSLLSRNFSRNLGINKPLSKVVVYRSMVLS